MSKRKGRAVFVGEKIWFVEEEPMRHPNRLSDMQKLRKLESVIQRGRKAMYTKLSFINEKNWKIVDDGIELPFNN